MTASPALAVVGAGFMGTGIAESAARAGLVVTIIDVDANRLSSSKGALTASLGRAVERGRLSEHEAQAALGAVRYEEDLASAAAADLAIEAVSENLEIKQSVMRGLDQVMPETALLASNTSSIPIASLAAVVSAPGRVLGLHFFSPVPAMPLVEVVRAMETSDEALATAVALTERLGKRAVITKDRSGFIVNMLLVPYLMAAVRMYEEGFAAAGDIDAAMRLGCGHPMGPLALCDLIGLDVLYAVCGSLFDEFKRPEYAPPPVLKRMVAAQRLGRKTGKGFYSYEDA